MVSSCISTWFNPCNHRCECVRLVTQSCLTPCDSVNRSPPGSSVLGVLQARTLKWAAISSSRASSWPKDWTLVFCVSSTEGRFFTHWAIQGSPVVVDGKCQFVGDIPWSIFLVFLNNIPQNHFNGTSPSKSKHSFRNGEWINRKGGLREISAAII